MATITWPDGKCGYCGVQPGGVLEAFTCPRCERRGCVHCLPTGNLVCIGCIRGERRDAAFNPLAPLSDFGTEDDPKWPEK